MRLVVSVEQREEELRRSSLRILAIRRALGMTQLEMAYFLGVTIAQLSRWENGRAKPSRLAEHAIRNVCAEHGLDLNRMRRFAV